MHCVEPSIEIVKLPFLSIAEDGDVWVKVCEQQNVSEVDVVCAQEHLRLEFFVVVLQSKERLEKVEESSYSKNGVFGSGKLPTDIDNREELHLEKGNNH